MRYYKKIPYWENVQRVYILNNFKALVIYYFNNVNISSFSGLKENENAIRTRASINKKVEKGTFDNINIWGIYNFKFISTYRT
ncbi:MAG: hypothetical protein K0A90_03925 [Methanosarcinaceae archaeon]|nr:hypothetical protein [Methanosarcinaceae archaeon]